MCVRAVPSLATAAVGAGANRCAVNLKERALQRGQVNCRFGFLRRKLGVKHVNTN